MAVLSPPGRAAIATIALLGRDAWTVVRACFRPATPAALPELPPSDRFWYGRIGDEAHGFDEVVVAVKQVEPLPCIEIHCHGGPQVVALLRDLLGQHGVCECSWQVAFEKTLPSLQASAAIALANVQTLRTAAILLDQYHGAFSQAVAQIVTDLRGGRPSPLPSLPPGERGKLDQLVRQTPLGRHLTTPWRVVVAGAPNVGKSSLVNALAGFERSIVSPIPGTTRDLVTTAIAIEGWPIELVDTAGWRSEAEPLEQQGILRAQLAAGEADLCLWLIDASAPPDEAQIVPVGFQRVINKIDLPPAWDIAQAHGMRVSARTGQGLDELCSLISRSLVAEPPPAGSAVPFTPALCDTVERAQTHCAAGQVADAIALLEGCLG